VPDPISGYVNRLETQATPGLAPRFVAFLTEDEAGQGTEIQVETHEVRLQSTLELAYATRRKVDVRYLDDGGGAKYVTLVNVLRREEPTRPPR
jgi:hypothetical protein